MLRKYQPDFQHYVKKIGAQAKKKWFSYKISVFGNGVEIRRFKTKEYDYSSSIMFQKIFQYIIGKRLDYKDMSMIFQSNMIVLTLMIFFDIHKYFMKKDNIKHFY